MVLAWLRFTSPRLFAYPRVCATTGVLVILGMWACMAFGVLIVPYHVFRTFAFTILDLGSALCITGAVAWTAATGLFAKVVRKISDISYGLYLMHLTILLAGGSWLMHGLLPTLIGVLTIPIALSLLSWHFFERPILGLRPRHTNGR